MNNLVKKLQMLVCLAAVICLTAVAGANDMRTHVFSSSIKSVKLSLASNAYVPPILILGGDERLNVNFDYLDYDVHYLRYSVTHCNADWTESMLMESEYVDGFNYADITDYEQSQTTFTHYYNYNFTLPNENFIITKSGNYLLRVYEQDDPDRVLFQCRFMVCENSVNVRPMVTSRTDVDYNREHQQVSFEVTAKSRGQIRDPYGEITAVVTQNSRTDNQVVVTRPMMVAGDVITYDHNPALIFEAGNEYRKFEMIDPGHPTMGLGFTTWDENEGRFHAFPYYAEPRPSYIYDEDADGAFIIRNTDNIEIDNTSDYVLVHYKMKPRRRYADANIRVDGWWATEPAENYNMEWDEEDKSYNVVLLQKLGYYNYQLLMVDYDGTTHLLPEEGSFYQTENRYAAFVYYKGTGERSWRLVGWNETKKK